MPKTEAVPNAVSLAQDVRPYGMPARIPRVLPLTQVSLHPPGKGVRTFPHRPATGKDITVVCGEKRELDIELLMVTKGNTSISPATRSAAAEADVDTSPGNLFGNNAYLDQAPNNAPEDRRKEHGDLSGCEATREHANQHPGPEQPNRQPLVKR